MTNVYNDGALHVHASLCSTCIFRPGNLMHLRAGRVEEMVETCMAGQGVIPCHQTLDDPQESVCRGFFNRYKHEVSLLSVAERMGVIAYTNPNHPDSHGDPEQVPAKKKEHP